MDRIQRLRAIYAAFNQRDIDTVLEQMTADADWPNGWEGGRVRGRPAVRAYWERQWAAIDPSVEPLSFEPRGDVLAGEVPHSLRDPEGILLPDGRVRRIYSFAGGQVARMEIEELE